MWERNSKPSQMDFMFAKKVRMWHWAFKAYDKQLHK